ncbi:MAG: nucleotidyltransferase family protein [Opitutus sp.]
MSKTEIQYGAVILAAGASSRMGQPKQILPLGGDPLVVRAIKAALDSSAWPVVVVLGAHAEKIRPLLVRYPVIIVENAAWVEGMASSIRTGIATLRQFSRRLEAAVLGLCDQPAFTATVVRELVEAQRKTGALIVAARYNGRNGAPALFMREQFSILENLTGEEGARSLLNGGPELIVSVDLPALAADVDTPEDYSRYTNDQGGLAGPTNTADRP